MHPTSIRPTTRRLSVLLGIVLLTSLAATVRAQCVGDCDGSNSVTVNELVLGTNIALERAAVSQCPVFDSDHSNTVTVNELVTGVNNLLRDCPVVNTPTPTRTPSGPTATPTPTLTPIAGCGNGTVDFDLGETCDDGNLDEGPGDDCPSDCRIATCTANGQTLDVDVSFTPPAGTDLAAVQVFVTYPEDVLRIPGRGNSNQVLDRFSNLVETVPVSYSFNDQDYAVSVLSFTEGDTIPVGRLFTVTFDRCGEIPPVTAFGCRVTDASPSPDGVTCAVTLP